MSTTETATTVVEVVPENKPSEKPKSTLLATVKNTDELPLSEAANALRLSGLVKANETVGQVFAKLSLGRNLGIPDIAALTGLNITDKGQILVSAALLQLLIKTSNKYKIRVKQRDDKGSQIEVFERDSYEGNWESCGVPITFGPADAKRAGLDTKDNYKKWPIDMYYARCLAAAFRTYCSECMRGVAMYLPDEIERSNYKTDVASGGIVQEAEFEVASKVKKVSGDGLSKVRVLLKETNSEESVWLKHFGVESLESLSDEQRLELEALLRKKKKVVVK